MADKIDVSAARIEQYKVERARLAREYEASLKRLAKVEPVVAAGFPSADAIVVGRPPQEGHQDPEAASDSDHDQGGDHPRPVKVGTPREASAIATCVGARGGFATPTTAKTTGSRARVRA
jgi:hypothetical protein